ncbi:MAG: TlpA family protein disulfide reductase [Bacteroidales bacterium]|nr:TlpA family protein disulfide reductase [Bacteroidales bacterium]
MKRILYFLLLILVVVSCKNSPKGETQSTEVETKSEVVADERGYIVKVGDMVPNIDINLLDGTSFNISELKGKVVMLQFTASWCGVCRKEMPFIERDIWNVYKDNPDFALYGIDLKESKEETEAFAAAIPVTYPLTLDLEGKSFYSFCGEGAGVTRNIILDREGKIIMLTRLFDEAEFAQMVEVIDNELNKE